MTKYLISGIDPGLTAAVALLNLDGKLISTKSSKYFSKSTLSKFVSNFGDPVIIACDRKFVPKFISKIAANFSARIVHPSHNLSKNEKIKLLKTFDIIPRTRHEKDALAAALYAWKRFKPLISRIDKKLPTGDHDLRERIKRAIILREEKNIDSAIEHYLEKKEIKKEEKPKIEVGVKESEAIKSLRTKLEMKIREIEILRNSSSTLKNRIKELEHTISKLKKEVSNRREEIGKELLDNKIGIIRNLKLRLENNELITNKLRNDLENLENLTVLLNKEWIPVLITNYCDKLSIRNLDNKYGIDNKWICVLSDKKISGINQLNSAKGVVCKGKLIELLKNKGVLTLDLAKVELKYHKNFGAIKIDLNMIKKEKEQSFLLWLEKYKKRAI